MFTVTCNVLNSSNDDICVTDRVLSQCSLPGWQCWLAWRGVMMLSSAGRSRQARRQF